MSDLKPCPVPWCWSHKQDDPEIRCYERPIVQTGYAVACVSCPVCGVKTAWLPTQDEAISAWNTRPTPAPAGEQYAQHKDNPPALSYGAARIGQEMEPAGGQAVGDAIDLEIKLWLIIDRDGLANVPSNIVEAVSRMVQQLAAKDAEIERLNGEIDAVKGRALRVSNAWAEQRKLLDQLAGALRAWKNADDYDGPLDKTIGRMLVHDAIEDRDAALDAAEQFGKGK